jgi:hypothetical protein
MFFQSSPATMSPLKLVVEKLRFSDQDYNWSKTCRTASLFGTFSPFNTRFCEAKPVLQYYTRQVMLFLAICIIYALTLSIILLSIIIVYERIIYIRHRIFPENPRCQIEILFRHINTPLRGVGSWVYTKYSKYFIAQPMHIVTRQCLNIRARPPTRWSGPTYKRKTSAAVRRVKSGVKRGFICGINGIYRDDEPSSSEFSDLTNGSNGNFGI